MRPGGGALIHVNSCLGPVRRADCSRQGGRIAADFARNAEPLRKLDDWRKSRIVGAVERDKRPTSPVRPPELFVFPVAGFLSAAGFVSHAWALIHPILLGCKSPEVAHRAFRECHLDSPNAPTPYWRELSRPLPHEGKYACLRWTNKSG